jgi:glycosyltransferase involved in cell wall biosynthesis
MRRQLLQMGYRKLLIIYGEFEEKDMKTVSVIVPTYNEEENVAPMAEAVMQIFEHELKEYGLELIFIDNFSKDNTRTILRKLCKKDTRIKCIFNAKNFGPFNSPYYGLTQSTGNCAVLLCADFQDPVHMIVDFVREWEKGYKIVIGVKTTSKENKIMYFLRSCYYKLIKKMSDVDQIEHFTGFGLYDEKFVDILTNLGDSTPFLRGIVAELGYERKEIQYKQEKRRAGKSSYSLYKLYDAAMLSFTSYTKIGLRLATFTGIFCSCISLVIALVYLVYKLIYWDRFAAGMTPILLGIFVFGSLQLFFIGLLGEYIMNMNSRIMNRPLVIEEERINF